MTDLKSYEFYRTDLGVLYCGDVLKVLRAVPDESAQCCVTSPPYWGLRDYKIEPQIWDGVEGCEHEWGDERITEAGRNDGGRDIGGRKGNYQGDGPHKAETSQGSFCIHCGAWRGSLGLEPTPELFVQHIVQVFREVRRVLKKDGTLFLNLGDTYAGYWGEKYAHRPFGEDRTADNTTPPNKPSLDFRNGSLKPKDLVGIPWMVAFALRADGWYLRSDIIWAKPNPMPESVTDRPTKSHEYLFLLAKSQKYYFDQEAVREPFADERMGNPGPSKQAYANDPITGKGIRGQGGPSTKLQEEGWNKNGDIKGRNIRSVWTIATQPFPEAHFATFPPKLVEPCIKAGSPMGGLVLDPFMGAGTVALVCEKLNRKWTGIELSPAYCEIAKRRIEPEAAQGKLFA